MKPGIVDQWLGIGAEGGIYVGYHQFGNPGLGGYPRGLSGAGVAPAVSQFLVFVCAESFMNQ
jgi:hypothetical protein